MWTGNSPRLRTSNSYYESEDTYGVPTRLHRIRATCSKLRITYPPSPEHMQILRDDLAASLAADEEPVSIIGTVFYRMHRFLQDVFSSLHPRNVVDAAAWFSNLITRRLARVGVEPVPAADEEAPEEEELGIDATTFFEEVDMEFDPAGESMRRIKPDEHLEEIRVHLKLATCSEPEDGGGHDGCGDVDLSQSNPDPEESQDLDDKSPNQQQLNTKKSIEVSIELG